MVVRGLQGACSCLSGVNCLRGWCLAQWAAVSLEAGSPTKCTVAGTTRLAGKPPEPP